MKRLVRSIIRFLQSLIGEKKVSDGNTLLSYLPSSSPAPLEVTASGTLTITIPVPSSATYCNQIALGIPYGTGSGNLTDNPLTTANISVSPSLGWQIGPGKADLGFKGDVAGFVLSTLSESYNLINYPIVITITIPVVNETPGPVQILVKENSCPDGVNYTMKDGTVNLDTAPYDQFYVRNFIASRSDGSGALVSETDYNNTVVLSWEGSDNQYNIIYDENTPIAVTGNSWTSPSLTHTTTFILQASQQSAATKKKKVNDPQTLYLYKTLTVIVRNPDVLANSLSVSGGSVLSGNASIAGALAAAGTLNVAGASTLANATVNGNAGIGGTLNVTGGTTLGSATVSSLQANSASLASASISGLLAANGTVSMMGVPVPLTAGSGSYSNNTDGFVVGIVGNPSDASIKCAAIAYAWSGPIVAYTTGGNYVFWMESDMESAYSWINPNTFILPVQQNAGYGINVWYANVNDQNPPVSLYWVPMGTSATDTIKKLSSEIPEERKLKIHPHKVKNTVPVVHS